MPRDDRTKEAFEMIEQGVIDVFSSDNFKNYLSFLSKFHTYSLNNQLLIMSQYPEATLVAGYNSWSKNFNRHVKKGEKAIKILAPYESKYMTTVEKRDENGQAILDKDGNVELEEKERKIISFMLVNVFDVAQTFGDPLPELDHHDLTGSSNESKALIESIKEICQIPIEFKEISNDSILQNGAKGYYDKSKDKIVVNGGMDDIQIAKTLAHEYAHSLLHKQSDKPSFQKEVEAESLAFVICDHFGIDTSDYSFTYVASYAAEDPAVLKQILLDIHSSAHDMIETLDPVFEEKYQSLQASVQYKIPENLSSSVERKNYEQLERFAKPVLTGDAYYMRLTATGMMDLHVERIGDDRIAMSHNFVQNGDLMADPDMEFIIDMDKELLIPQTYQQDALAYFTTTDGRQDKTDELSDFTTQWLENIENSRYRIAEISTEDFTYTSEDNYKDMKALLSDFGMARMMEKRKEEMER